MAERFRGMTAMVTGAAGGFGAAAARRLAAEGADLLLSDVDAAALEALAGALPGAPRVLAERVDVASGAEVAAHVARGEEELGPLGVAVNNAGIGQDLAPLHETGEEAFDRVMAVNARGVFLCMAAQLPGMAARGSGAIVNVASAAGLVGAGGLAAYSASKHAVVGLTRSAADEVARRGVRVNAVCPSFAATPMLDEIAGSLAARRGEEPSAAVARLVGRVPMRRAAAVDEVVQAILWAADPANGFMTGQAIAIDGGLTAV